MDTSPLEDQSHENWTSDWLTDSHMSMAQSLLQKQYPNQNGLQDCCQLYYYHKWNSHTQDFIQIINIGNHWVCVSNIGCPGGVVDVYDSSPHHSNNPILCDQVARMLEDPSRLFTIRHPKVQFQIGDADCGLFAIAFATALCSRVDPSQLSFDQFKMRQHLVDCFNNGKITPFPLMGHSLIR